MRTKDQSTQSEAMDSIARSLPSLMRAAKIQKKAAKAGFDFENMFTKDNIFDLFPRKILKLVTTDKSYETAKINENDVLTIPQQRGTINIVNMANK